MKRALSGYLLVVVPMAGLVAGAGVPSAVQTAEELIESGHVRIRHRLEPAEPVYVGQPVRVWVEVMTRTWFLEAPRYPSTIEVQNAIVIPPEAFAVNSSERIGADTYAVQGRAFTVFPQTTGRFEVPPIQVQLVVAREDASRSPEIVLRTEPLTIEARLPAEAAGHGLVLSTPSLSIEERYSRSTENLRVGDSFKRRVTMTIDDSVAMLLPPIPFEALAGIAVYPARPEVTDQRNRGQLAGTRVEEATYLMEAEGTYELPEVTLWWWNLRTSSLEEEVLPAVEFTVQANPDLAAEHLGEPRNANTDSQSPPEVEGDRVGWREWVISVIALAVVVWLVRRFSRRSSSGLVGKSPEAVEEELFRRLETAAGKGDPAATYQALLRWLDRFPGVDRPATATRFLDLAGDDELDRRLRALERSLFGPREITDPQAWDPSRFASSVARARARILKRGQQEANRLTELPTLNPHG